MSSTTEFIAEGATTGTVTPGGRIDVGSTLVGLYEIRVSIVAGGACGVATWRYSLDGGATFGATATTPAAGTKAPLYDLASGVDLGLTVVFNGTFSANDRWDWTAESIALKSLEWATGEMNSILGDRYRGGITTPYPDDLIGHETSLAVWRALKTRGFNPDNANDRVVITGKTDAETWAAEVAEYKRHPAIVEAAAVAQLLPLSDPLVLTSTRDCDD